MEDNLEIQKNWQDLNMMRLSVEARSNLAWVRQNFCAYEEDFLSAGDVIAGYSASPDGRCRVEFGDKDSEWNTFFSMTFMPADFRGHVKIEVDAEIEDGSPLHRCRFFVKSELGLVEEFGRRLALFSRAPVGKTLSLASSG